MELSGTLIHKLDENEICFKTLNGLYPGLNENSPLFKRLNKVSLVNYFTPNDFNSLLSSCLKLEENLYFYKNFDSSNFNIFSLLSSETQLGDQYLNTKKPRLKNRN